MAMPRKEGQIVERGTDRKTGQQKWLVRVPNGEDADGRRVYISRTVRGGIRDAQKALRELLSQRDEGTVHRATTETVGAYLERWLQTHKTSVKTRTYLNDQEMIARYIQPHLGRQKLDKLTPMKIQSAYSTLQESGLSASTIRRAHAVLRNALKWAVQWQIIATNPALRVQLPKVEKAEMRPLTPDEASLFLQECAFEPHGVLFQFLLLTGCRPGEAFALRWQDIDFENGYVSIQRTYGTKGGLELYSSPKTKKGRRKIPILDHDLLESLRVTKTEVIEKCLASGIKFEESGLVFPSSKGTPIHARNLIQRHFKPMLRRLGIPHTVRLYDLRHSTATLLLSLNIHPKVVQEMLGHSDIQLTLNTYSHVLPSLQQDAAKKLSERLSQRS